ncbi:cellulose synthase operon protein C, partial [Pseudomonas syringae pv. actinidiae ICMP 19101]
YRIRQADLLREGGDLAGAYDTLAPALAQRPDDIQAVSAFARMYTANGDSARAFELYKPLLQRPSATRRNTEVLPEIVLPGQGGMVIADGQRHDTPRY